MTFVQELLPENLDEEKQKFHANHHYNPQFRYSRPFTTQQLTRYGLPQPSILKQAEAYLAKGVPDRKYIPSQCLSIEEISQVINQLFAQLNLPPLGIKITTTGVTRLSVTRDQIIINQSLAKFNLPRLQSALAHEVQTHYLRSHNQRLQQFSSPPRREYIRTEEGLAVIMRSFYSQVLNFNSACRLYVGIAKAQTMSFSEIFAWRTKFFSTDFDRAWTATVRLKRGLEDTSRGGGYTKDLVYFEGLLEVLAWLDQPNHQVQDLYLGKIPWQKVDTYKTQATTKGLVYPDFVPNRLADFQSWVHSCRLELALPPL